MAREINLVPDVKDEMIKTLKLRNYIFFACIVIASASVAVTTIFGLIAGGQQLARDSKKETISALSNKLNSYSDLKDSLTIRDQLKNISTITDHKTVFSRTFSALTAFIPTGADKITISELEVSLGSSDTADDLDADRAQPSLRITGQANAGKEPFIDYNVLDSFKKSMQYMRYDYGNYVDKEGNTIPSYCMIEQDDDGATFNDAEKGIYAYWTIDADGCNPSDSLKESDYTLENYNEKEVVKVWRTPQFAEWYKESEQEGKPYMSADGAISNVEHFESQCVSYSKDDSSSAANPKFNDTNECRLVTDELEENDGIVIMESSNGRDSSDELVLRFIAEVYLAPEFYDFNNNHMLAIAPSGRRNVTDSYVQVQAMFGKRARDCSKDDAACNSSDNTETTNSLNSNSQNSNSNSNSSSNSNNNSNNSNSSSNSNNQDNRNNTQVKDE